MGAMQQALLGAGGGNSTLTFLGYTAGNTGISAGVSVNKPSGVQSGDLLVAVLSAYDGATAITWTPPSGWTEQVDQGAVGNNMAVMTKTAGGSEPVFYTFTSTYDGSGGEIVGHVLAYRNAALDAVGSLATMSGTGSLVIPQITMTGSGVLLAGIAQQGGTPSAPTIAGFTEISDISYPSNMRHSVLTTDIAAGATGSKTANISGIAGPANSTGVLIGVKQA